MRFGPNKRTPGELKDQLLRARRVYREGKEKAFEQSITFAESRMSWWFSLLFVSLTFAGWFVAIVFEPPIEKIYDLYGFLPIVFVFFISYFALFHLSKQIFKPSDEEVADDTSYFALFSACAARERHGLHSAAFGAANTFALILYMLLTQPGHDDWRLF